jgi:tetratricopeptide (TPR) repeat protein
MPTSPDIAPLLESANELAQAENYFKASQQFQRAVEIKPNQADLHAKLAYTLSRRRKYSEAADECLKVFQLDRELAGKRIEVQGNYQNKTVFRIWANAYEKLTPDDRKIRLEGFHALLPASNQRAAAYIAWGNAIREDGSEQQAAEKYAAAASIDSIPAEAHKAWGDCLLKLTRPDAASEKYQQAISTQTDYAPAHAALASLLCDQGKKAEALEHFLNAIEHGPDTVNYYKWTDLLASPDVKPETASARVEQIVAKNPERSLFYESWGWQLFAMDRYAEAEEKFANAAKARPSSPQAYRGWTAVLFEQGPGKYPVFVEKFLEAIEHGHADFLEYGYWDSALSALPADDRTAAAKRFNQVVENDSKRALAHLHWAEVQANDEKHAEAESNFKLAAQFLPANAEAYLGWAAALHAQGPRDQQVAAAGKFLEALELGGYQTGHSIEVEIWNDCYEALSSAEQEAAEEKLKIIAASQPQMASFFVEWADFLNASNLDEKAYKRYNQALSLAPNHASARLGLAGCLARQKKYEEAIKEYLAVAKDSPQAITWKEWIETLGKLPKEKLAQSDEAMLAALAAKSSAASVYHDWGSALYNKIDYEKACDRQRRATDDNPELIRAYSYWGWSLYALQRFADAGAKFEQALNLDNNNEEGQAPGIYRGWGWNFYGARCFSEAEARFRKSITLDPQLTFARDALGSVLLDQKRYEAGCEELRQLLELDSQNINGYLSWGACLISMGKDSDAVEKYQKALAVADNRDPGIADRYFYWGNALAREQRYEEAIEKYRTALEKDPDHAYSLTNIASYLGDMGRYKESRAEMEAAVRAYKKGLAKAREEGNASYLRYMATVLKELGNLEEAEKYLIEGLALSPTNLDILTELTALYAQQAESRTLANGAPDAEGRTRALWKARESYRRAKGLLQYHYQGADDATLYLQWGRMHLTMGEYDEARKQLLEALNRDPELAGAHNQLGVLSVRLEDYKKAAEYFCNALRYEPNNLTAKSNLAEAYLKAEMLDKSEATYKAILTVTANHIESEIGLGQVYIAMADNKKDDALYEEAISHLNRAIAIGKATPNSASKRMEKREWAPVYYQLGYAGVKLYSATKLLADEVRLRKARINFETALKEDPEYYKAQRALNSIKEGLRPQERWLEKWAPFTILAMAFFLFVLTQVSFLRQGKFYDLKYYVPVSFGALVLMIAGFYLPKLLKLKVAGIELEKSAVDQVSSLRGLEISK